MKIGLVGPLGGVLASPILGSPIYLETEVPEIIVDDPLYLELITLYAKFNGTQNKEEISNYINEYQSLGVNTVFKIEPTNPVIKISKDGQDTVYEYPIVDNIAVIPKDILTSGYWGLYVFDNNSRTASQSFMFHVSKLPF